MTIKSTETIARDVIHGQTDEVIGLINPVNDGNLAAWMMALDRAERMVATIQTVCNDVSMRGIGPGHAALRAIAGIPISTPEEDESFAVYESEVLRVAEMREAQKIDASHPEVFSITDFAAQVCGMKKGV